MRAVKHRHKGILGLFVGAATMQILDWHSTLTATAGREETNKAINWMAQWCGLTCAVSFSKLALLALLGFLFAWWQQTDGTCDREFALALSLVCIVYVFIIINNYPHG